LFVAGNRNIEEVTQAKEISSMELSQLNVMYGHLEGTDGKFARDPSGYLSIEAGIYEKHGLQVTWRHVQGTEARYQQLESGAAHISMVVGRASLQHFLDIGSTRILGCVMNSCSYYLMAAAGIEKLSGLEGKALSCRKAPSRGVDFNRLLRERGGLDLGHNFALQLPDTDQEAFGQLIQGRVQAAWLPRPYAFVAEEAGFVRLHEGSGIIDDPLPITIETTKGLLNQRGRDLARFIAAHSEGVRYLLDHRDATIHLLQTRFGHSPQLAAKTFDDYLVCMDDALAVEFGCLEKLIAQVAPNTPGGAEEIAREWIAPGALRQ
jgi:ABC-type nitrate/sulfonate/bicarbonate transport system substrate-binding protein